MLTLTTNRTPPQDLVVPIYLGSGIKGPNTLVLLFNPEEKGDQPDPRRFMPNESSTFALSGQSVPAIPGFDMVGRVAHDVVSLSGITLPNQKIGTPYPLERSDEQSWPALNRFSNGS